VAYRPREYWSRLHQRHNLSAVGQSGLPDAMNVWLYRIQARNLRAFLRQCGLDRRPPRRVFEVGVGTGFWIPFWKGLGAEVVSGCDLVPRAVEELNARYGGGASPFRVADVSDSVDLDGEAFDLVTVLNVLLHVTDEARFQRAIGNIVRLVAPGGALLLAEPILVDARWERQYRPELSSIARARRRYEDPIMAAGFRLEAMAAGTVLAGNPIEARSRVAYVLFRGWWALLSGSTRVWAGNARWLGPLTYLLDSLATRTRAMPSGKFALYRKPG